MQKRVFNMASSEAVKLVTESRDTHFKIIESEKIDEPKKILKQGAESKLYTAKYGDRVFLVKERFPKKYRHPVLDDQLTRERIHAEHRNAKRCAEAGVLTPKMYDSDLKLRKLYMEYLDKAITVKTYINDNLNPDEPKQFNEKIGILAEHIGTAIGKLHANNIIHGDLTTSNMMLNPKDLKFVEYDFFMIDFGLSKYHSNAEDKGVDLYVLERALLSTHSGIPEFFSLILKAYKAQNTSKNSDDILLKYNEVRARGRKRTMVG